MAGPNDLIRALAHSDGDRSYRVLVIDDDTVEPTLRRAMPSCSILSPPATNASGSTSSICSATGASIA